MKVKVQKLDGTAGRATSSSTMPCSASSRAPTSCTASSPGSSRTAAAPPAPTRERSDVARTGKKFGRQKGGGTARHGDRARPDLHRRRQGARRPPARVRRVAQQEGPRARPQDGALGQGQGRPGRRRQPRAQGRQDQGAQGQLRQGGLDGKVLVIDGDAVDDGFAPRRRQPVGRQRAAGRRRQRLRHPEA